MRALLAFGLVSCIGAGAAAQTPPDDLCPPAIEGVQETFPADGASGVALDALVRVRYGVPPVGNVEGRVSLHEVRSGAEIPGTITRIGNELVFRASVLLTASRSIEVNAYDPLTDGYTSHFTTGTGREAGPPEFDAITDATSEEQKQAGCNAPGGGFRVTSVFDPASDDGPGADVEYVLYQTRGPGLEGPTERARVRGLLPDQQQFAAFLLPRDEATSAICLSVLAYDGQGQVGGSGEEHCLDPVQGNFFASCSAAAGRPRTAAPIAMGFVLFALAASRRRRPRRSTR